MSELGVGATFILDAICEFGQSPKTRIAAVQKVLDAAGFKAKAKCYPVFGGIWKGECTGPDGIEAKAWLQSLTDNLKRGKLEKEVEYVERQVEARAKL